MAFPAVPSFEYVEPAVIVAYYDTHVLGQVKSVQGETTANEPESEVRRLGDADATSIFGAANYKSTASFEIYVQDEADELLLLLDDASPSELDVANTGTLKIEIYDSETGGVLEHSRAPANAVPISDSFSVDADTVPATYTVGFRSTSKWITTVT